MESKWKKFEHFYLLFGQWGANLGITKCNTYLLTFTVMETEPSDFTLHSKQLSIHGNCCKLSHQHIVSLRSHSQCINTQWVYLHLKLHKALVCVHMCVTYELRTIANFPILFIYEFILFGSKKQRERLSACFPIDILGNPFTPLSLSGTWVCGLTLISPSQNMYRNFVKAASVN